MGENESNVKRAALREKNRKHIWSRCSKKDIWMSWLSFTLTDASWNQVYFSLSTVLFFFIPFFFSLPPTLSMSLFTFCPTFPLKVHQHPPTHTLTHPHPLHTHTLSPYFFFYTLVVFLMPTWRMMSESGEYIFMWVSPSVLLQEHILVYSALSLVFVFFTGMRQFFCE